MELQDIDFDVKFRKGFNNQNVDALSRLPFQNTEEQTGLIQSNDELHIPSPETHKSIPTASLSENPVSSVTDSHHIETSIIISENIISNSDISVVSPCSDNSQICSAQTIN